MAEHVEDLIPVQCDECSTTVVLTAREEARIQGAFFCSDRCEDRAADRSTDREYDRPAEYRQQMEAARRLK